jgi:hypothetical protein
MNRQSNSVQNGIAKKIRSIISLAASLLIGANPAFAAGVPDAESMMKVAFVAGLILLIIVINAVFGVWVYKDAKHRGMQKPAGWIVAVVITGALGLIGYMIARPKGNVEEPPK